MLKSSAEIINAYKAQLVTLNIQAAPQQSIVHEVKHTFAADAIDLSGITLAWATPRQNSTTKQWFTTLAVKGLEPERCFFGGNGYKALNEGEAVPTVVPVINRLCIATLVVQESRKAILQPKIDALILAHSKETDINKKNLIQIEMDKLKLQLTPEGNASLVVY
jgi:hypothetical protein